MMVVSAYVFIGLSVLVGLFQIALIFGAPLGEYTLGGKFPGKLPGKLRIAAAVQIVILGVFVFFAVSKAGVALSEYYSAARIGIWFTAAFFLFGTAANLSSESRKERLVMGPANIIACICTLILALG